MLITWIDEENQDIQNYIIYFSESEFNYFDLPEPMMVVSGEKRSVNIDVTASSGFIRIGAFDGSTTKISSLFSILKLPDTIWYGATSYISTSIAREAKCTTPHPDQGKIYVGRSVGLYDDGGLSIYSDGGQLLKTSGISKPFTSVSLSNDLSLVSAVSDNVSTPYVFDSELSSQFQVEDLSQLGITHSSAFSLDDTYLAVCGDNSPYIIILDTSNFSVYKNLSGIDRPIKEVLFSKDGYHLIAIAEGGIFLINTISWVVENYFSTTIDYVFDSSVSSDGYYLAVCGTSDTDSSLFVFDLKNSLPVSLPKSLTDSLSLRIESCSFSMDSSYLVVEPRDNNTGLLFINTTDWTSFDVLSGVPELSSSSSAISFSTQGDKVYFYSNNKLIILDSV